ncbi:MAG TPA: cobalamin-dependent protein [Candidatus Binatia bacterium]|nr:cobalamin-dependent protein [Candidatus Binatia bacterium]
MRASKLLLAKTSLDGHWRGPLVVTQALRDAGFEVVFAGMATVEEIVRAAMDEDVDLVGLSVGGRVEIAERIVDALRSAGMDVPVMAGGTLAPEACRRLSERGVVTFPPGSSLEAIVETARSLTADRVRSQGGGTEEAT